jgi:hypothetical protein
VRRDVLLLVGAFSASLVAATTTPRLSAVPIRQTPRVVEGVAERPTSESLAARAARIDLGFVELRRDATTRFAHFGAQHSPLEAPWGVSGSMRGFDLREHHADLAAVFDALGR